MTGMPVFMRDELRECVCMLPFVRMCVLCVLEKKGGMRFQG